MTSEQFAYWLQGYAELNEAPPTTEQWQAIREHLALVFHKVTPPLAQGINEFNMDALIRRETAKQNSNYGLQRGLIGNPDVRVTC